MKHLFLLLLAALFIQLNAQVADTIIYTMPQESARFLGGDSSLYRFIAKNIVYPKACADSGIQGKVYISSIIESDGKVSSVKVIRRVHPLLDREAERVIMLLPAFKPANNQGVAVRSQLMIPVTFKVKVKEITTLPVNSDLLKVVSKVDVPPAFPGGLKTLEKYLDYIFEYPYLCTKLNIQGLCRVKFLLDTNGQVTNVEVIKGVHFDLDNEAVKVVKLLPDFSPAIKDNKPVPCEMEMSMNFTLACSADDIPFSDEDDYRLKYPGGFTAMINQIFNNVYYTGDLSGFGINGKSVISFDVDTGGKVKNISVLKSTSPDIEKAVIRSIERLEKFKPGFLGEVKRPATIVIPVKYKVNTNSAMQNELVFDKKFSFVRTGNTNEEYGYIDDKPEFDGVSLDNISRVLHNYLELPEGEEANRDKGYIYVRCFITDDAHIENVRIYKGLTPGLEKEAMRAIKAIENINPATRLGKPVGCEVLIPVSFANF